MTKKNGESDEKLKPEDLDGVDEETGVVEGEIDDSEDEVFSEEWPEPGLDGDEDDEKACETCDGEGACLECEGTGLVEEYDCTYCGGNGECPTCSRDDD